MSSEGSSSTTKWVIGCLAVGFLGVVVCGGGGILAVRMAFNRTRDAVREAQRAAQDAQREMVAQQEETDFGVEWAPPTAGATADVLFPEYVDAWRRMSQDDAAEIPELGLTRSGQHAVYESGIVGIDVYVYQLPGSEQSAVFQAAEDAISSGGYSQQSKFSLDDGQTHRLTFSFSPPERHGRMWWCKGWLLVFIADDAEIDLTTFQREYATQIQSTPQDMQPEPDAPGNVDDLPAAEPVPEATSE